MWQFVFIFDEMVAADSLRMTGKGIFEVALDYELNGDPIGLLVYLKPTTDAMDVLCLQLVISFS